MEPNINRLTSGLGLCATLLATPFDSRPALAALAQPERQDKTVRMIYLVSKDREVREEYRAAIEHAIRDLQKWYAGQLGGVTFKLHEPVVEVVRSDKTADWFTQNPNGQNRDDWGFNNSLAEASRLIGAKQGHARHIFILYSDGPGNKGRGGGGVAYLPEDDLLGLVGRHPTQKDPLRWIAGLGHELGHAFGLPHPQDTVKDADAIMWAGFYGKYPDRCYLTATDKQSLLHSPFFFDKEGRPVTGREVFSEWYSYEGGFFGKLEKSDLWKEQKSDGSAAFLFQEVKRDSDWIVLKDAGRGFTIRLPVQGGFSGLSADDGKTWGSLYQVRRGAKATAGGS